MGQPDTFDHATKMQDTTEVDRLAEVRVANAQEHELTFFQALRLYPKGVFWSMVMSTAVVIEGYDTKLIGTLFAQPAFQKAYGEPVKEKTDSYQITAAWQSGLSNGSTVGMLGGLLIAGIISERYGFRITMITGLSIIIALIFITFFAPSLVVLEIGQCLFGIPLGLFQTTPVIYALEISPLCLRAYLTKYVNFCWAFAQLIATGVLRGVLNRSDHWAYRIPFAIQAVVKRLTSTRNIDFDIEKNIALMIATTEHERAVNAETSYCACFQGTNLRRTMIVIGIYCVQTLNGNPLRGYSTYFLEQAGLPTTQAFNMTIAGFAVAIVGGFFSWVLLPISGRRAIYVWSLVLMFIIMILVGALGVPQSSHPKGSYAWAIGSILLVSSFLYNCSIGPLTNTLCSEIPSALLRSKSIVLARWSYAVTTIVAGVLTPYQLNPTAWNWGAKTGFFWAGGCFISVVFAFFCVPEPKADYRRVRYFVRKECAFAQVLEHSRRCG